MLQVAPEQPRIYKFDPPSRACSQRVLWLGAQTQINTLHVFWSASRIGEGAAKLEDPGTFPKEVHTVQY